MTRISSGAIVIIIAVLLAVLGSMALEYTVKVPDGLAFSDFNPAVVKPKGQCPTSFGPRLLGR